MNGSLSKDGTKLQKSIKENYIPVVNFGVVFLVTFLTLFIKLMCR